MRSIQQTLRSVKKEVDSQKSTLPQQTIAPFSAIGAINPKAANIASTLFNFEPSNYCSQTAFRATARLQSFCYDDVDAMSSENNQRELYPEIEPCEDFVGTTNGCAYPFLEGSQPALGSNNQAPILSSVNHHFYSQLSGLSQQQRIQQQTTEPDQNFFKNQQLPQRKLSSVSIASILRQNQQQQIFQQSLTSLNNHLKDSSSNSREQIRRKKSPIASPLLIARPSLGKGITQLRLPQPQYAHIYFGEAFNSRQAELSSTQLAGEGNFIQQSTQHQKSLSPKPSMSIDSDQEMLQYVEDPSLFEFNQCNDQDYADVYEPTPMPQNWQNTSLDCEIQIAPMVSQQYFEDQEANEQLYAIRNLSAFGTQQYKDTAAIQQFTEFKSSQHKNFGDQLVQELTQFVNFEPQLKVDDNHVQIYQGEEPHAQCANYQKKLSAVAAEDMTMISASSTPRVRKLNGILKKDKNGLTKKYELSSQSSLISSDVHLVQRGQNIMIGPLSEIERLHRVQRFLAKKRSTHDLKKHSYKCRKQVADKRLRIKGRFVTKDQAFQILGLSQEELLDNQTIQNLLTQHADDPIQLNSVITSSHNGAQTIKIRNFQALIDKSYSHNRPSATDKNDSTALSGNEDDLQRSMIRLNLHMSSVSDRRFEVLQNYVQPLFKIEKVVRN